MLEASLDTEPRNSKPKKQNMSTERTAGDIFDELLGIAKRNTIFTKTPGHPDDLVMMIPEAADIVNEAIEFCLNRGRMPNCALEIPAGERPVRLQTLTSRHFYNLCAVLVDVDVEAMSKS